MGNHAALLYVVYNVILISRLYGDVGYADATVNNAMHARMFTTKILAPNFFAPDIILEKIESGIISHQKSLRQKLSLQQKLILAPNIIVPAIIIKQKESGIFIAQKSLHQKAETMAIDTLTLENGLIFQKSLRQKLSLQHKLNYDENVNIPQLAAVFVAPNFDDGDQTPSLDVLTGVQFVVGSLLLPTLFFPAPRGIPDGNIVLGGGSGGAVVIRGGYSLHLKIFSISQRFILFQIMLCVMVID
eukprot:UN10921